MLMSFSSNSAAGRRRARGTSRHGRRDRNRQQLGLERLENRIVLTADTWTGQAAKLVQDYHWSNANNWSDGVPKSGQDLVFPAAGAATFVPAAAMVNDLSGMTFDSIEIDGPGYTFTGDALTLSAATGLFTTYGAGVSTYSIDTTLSESGVTIKAGGELDIDGTVTGGNGVVLTGGGILGGTGQLPMLTVEGSEVQPGVLGVGKLSTQGDVTLDPASTFSASINGPGSNSALQVFGSVNASVALESPALVLAPSIYVPTPGSAFTIIQGDITGNFGGLPEGAYDVSGVTTYRVTYDQGVVLTAVVPTTIATSVQSGSTSSVVGQSVTLVATVSAAAGTPTGTVTFDDAGTQIGTASVNASGVATFTTSALALGGHSITSSYSGSAAFASSTSPTLGLTVNQDNTSTVVTSSANPSAFGQIISLTATVGADAPGGGTPTGSVTFYDGTTELTEVGLNAGGAAIYTTAGLALGPHSITAVYSGDNNFIASTSPALDQIVNLEATNTTVVSSANPSNFGQSVTFTAQVSGAVSVSGTPTGSVTFFDGTTELGSATLSGGSASFSTSGLSRGSHPITADYSGDPNFAAGKSPVLNQAVNQSNTDTTLTTVPSAIVLGQSVTFTASVTAASPGAGVPTGSVTFFDGTTALGTVTLSSGAASFSPTALGLGAHSITADYTGDGNDFNASTSSPSIEQVGGTTVTVVASPNPSTFDQSVTLTATVAADAVGSPVPSGSVTFMDGTTDLGTAGLGASGTASISTAALIGGTHAITAVYAGNAQFAGSTSSVSNLVVNPESTTTTTLISPSTGGSTFGQNVTITATVTAAVGTPTGSVTFKDGNTVLATSPLNASGIATFSSSTLSVGDHSLYAVFGGTASYASSPASKVTFVVAATTTTTTLAIPTSQPAVGQLLTLTATVAPVSPAAGSPTGMVAFKDGSSVLGTAAVSDGKASITIALSGVGTAQGIEASFVGSGGFLASDSSSQSVTVIQASPTATLSATPLFLGSKAKGVNFEVVVLAQGASTIVPGGTVTLEIGRRKYRTAVLTDGSATLFVPKARATGQTFTVHYSGDANDKPEVSSAVRIRSSFFKR